MNIIQSYWACNKKDLLSDQSGWLAPEYNLMSWALSCLQLRKFYKNVHLYADEVTSKLLIDELGLPYTKVFCNLDEINGYHPELWALPKLQVYAQQDEPFLHVDGDVFIWKPFDDLLINSELIAQNLECATIYYESIMTELESNLSYFPPEILNERSLNRPILAYNAGIFGGRDTDFFKKYSKKAFEFVNKNINQLPKIRVGNFNIFFEQYLFYCMSKKEGKNIAVLFDEVIGDNEYKGFGDFIEVPHHKQYLHLLGDYKRNETVCSQLAGYLRNYYPEYYYKIIALYKKNKVSLFHDYYSRIDDLTEEKFLIRHDTLKNQHQRGLLPSKAKVEIGVSVEIKVTNVKNANPDVSFDLESFYKSLSVIRNNEFRNLSIDYLYGRDINVAWYFTEIFADKKNMYGKYLIAERHIELIKSKYDWAEVNHPKFQIDGKFLQESPVLTAVIPECNTIGHSFCKIDLLDIEILNFLKSEKTIGRVLNHCKKFFHKKDLDESEMEYELLIIGRIKRSLFNKLIRRHIQHELARDSSGRSIDEYVKN